MKRTLKTPLVIALAVVVTLASAAFAAPEAALTRLQESAGASLQNALDAIDATPAQRQALRGLANEVYVDVVHAAHRSAPTAHALLAEWRKDAPDVNTVHALVDDGLAEAGALAHRGADVALRAHGVLKRDQRERLVRITERRLERRGL